VSTWCNPQIKISRRVRVKISEVKIRKVEGKDKFKAWATITFDNSFRVHGLKVIEGKNGPFVAMPSRKLSNGEFIDTAYPLNEELRGTIQKEVLAEYSREES
jgi:stage V sporulation protein G